MSIDIAPKSIDGTMLRIPRWCELVYLGLVSWPAENAPLTHGRQSFDIGNDGKKCKQPSESVKPTLGLGELVLLWVHVWKRQNLGGVMG